MKKRLPCRLGTRGGKTAVPLSFLTQKPVTRASRRASASPALPDALPKPRRRHALSRCRALSDRWQHGTLSVQHAIIQLHYSRTAGRCQDFAYRPARPAGAEKRMWFSKKDIFWKRFRLFKRFYKNIRKRLYLFGAGAIIKPLQAGSCLCKWSNIECCIENHGFWLWAAL